MDVRKKLDELKELWGFDTDSELAKKLETAKHNIDSWVKRGKIPEKWEWKIGQMSISESENLPVSQEKEQIKPANTLKNHIGDREMEIITAFRELSADKQELYYHKIKAEALEERLKNQPVSPSDAKYA